MATITIRGLDDAVRDKLRLMAAANQRSMEAEVRDILTRSVQTARPRSVAVALRRLAAEVGPVDLELPARTDEARAADFSG